jgi:hypothetical protein
MWRPRLTGPESKESLKSDLIFKFQWILEFRRFGNFYKEI